MEAIAAATSILSIAFFLIYLVGMFVMPDHDRPKTPTLDRFGNTIAETENPGFEETEDESDNP